jgi:hypothetical protein
MHQSQYGAQQTAHHNCPSVVPLAQVLRLHHHYTDSLLAFQALRENQMRVDLPEWWKLNIVAAKPSQAADVVFVTVPKMPQPFHYFRFSFLATWRVQSSERECRKNTASTARAIAPRIE